MKLYRALIELLEARAELLREETARRFLESGTTNCD
jgi:hypothetical protein